MRCWLQTKQNALRPVLPDWRYRISADIVTESRAGQRQPLKAVWRQLRRSLTVSLTTLFGMFIILFLIVVLHQSLHPDVVFQKSYYIFWCMAVIPLPFRHSPVGDMKILTEFLSVHPGAFSQFNDSIFKLHMSLLSIEAEIHIVYPLFHKSGRYAMCILLSQALFNPP